MDIQLLPFQEDDFQRLINWVPTAEFMLMWSGRYFDFPLTEDQLSNYLKTGEGNPPPRKIYKAVNRQTDEVVGHIELNNIDWKNLSGMVSKVIVGAESARGQGTGGRMVEQLVEVGFNELGLHRLTLHVFDFNRPAIACYQKVGFKIEGHLIDFRKAGDRYYSLYLMALLEPEWRNSRLQKAS